MTIDISTFITDNNLTETDRENLETMIEVYAHRLDLGTLRLTGSGWIVADITCSTRTAAKFAARLKSEVRASFLGADCAGVKAEG